MLALCSVISPVMTSIAFPPTPTSKKISHGDVAKLRYIFSYLAVAFEASFAQAITNCDKPT